VRRLQDRSEVIAAILRDERDAVSFTEELDRVGAAHVEHLLAKSRPMDHARRQMYCSTRSRPRYIA